MINRDYVQYVNPYIGSVGHLLTATRPYTMLPHGMIKVCPVFQHDLIDIYTATQIYGISCGQVKILPTSNFKDIDDRQLASEFDHDNEVSKPHYYEVYLQDYEIMAQATASQHSGILKFDYLLNRNRYVIIYLGQDTEYYLREDQLYIKSTNEGVSRYSVCKFSYETKQIASQQNNMYQVLVFEVDSKEIEIRIGESYISFEQAIFNMEKEVLQESFESIKEEGFKAWNALLSKIEVDSPNTKYLRMFYSALYRAHLRMTCYSEYGKYYSGYDQAVHDDEGYSFYADDGMWDTYRSMHPLQMILEPEVHKDVIKSYLRMYDQIGYLPTFPSISGERAVMLGNHTASLLVDAMCKGVQFDYVKAFEAIKINSLHRSKLPWYRGVSTILDDFYEQNNYFPALEEDEEESVVEVHPFENRQSVAVTLEHSYDDWCALQIAKKVGTEKDIQLFTKKSKAYVNVFNKAEQFVWPRREDGEFVRSFNPRLCGGQGGRKYFAENNAWIYTFNVVHEIEEYMELFGGSEEFRRKLDNLFTEQYGCPKYNFLNQYPDATGLIGQYCQGNEPSFHIPYLYNYTDTPWKTQKVIHDIIRLWFADHPLGICGDEDGGAMTSWFAFSAMGFYPICPGKPEYEIGSPIFNKIKINLPDNKEFIIKVERTSRNEKYIQEVCLNGKILSRPRFMHKDLIKGGELVLKMGKYPNKKLFIK